MARFQPSTSVRVGASLIGLVAGLVLGGIAGIAALASGLSDSVSLVVWVFGVGVVLAAVCFAVPSVGFDLLPSAVSFLWGLLQGLSLNPDRPEAAMRRWMKAAFFWVRQSEQLRFSCSTFSVCSYAT